MNIDISQPVYFQYEGRYLCFKHAVMKALDSKHIEVFTEDHSEDYYIGNDECVICKAIKENA